MRHGKKFNHLSRTNSHRKSLLINMTNSLILAKRINTTLAKAKALKKFVEPIITKSKEDTVHSRRVVFSKLKNKDSIKELFDNVIDKIGERPGGYTRIIKLGTRLGDNAETAMIELVDYNELLLKKETTKSSKRARRRGKKKSNKSDQTPTPETLEASNEVVDEVNTSSDSVEDITPVEAVAEAPVEAVAEAPVVEEVAEAPVEAVAEAPVEEEVAEAPVEEEVAEAPVVEEVAEAPVVEEVAEAPVEEVVTETPVDDVVTDTTEVKDSKELTTDSPSGEDSNSDSSNSSEVEEEKK